MRLSCFSCGSPNLVKLEFGELVFVEVGKQEKAEKKPCSKERINDKLNPQVAPGLGRNRTLSTLVEDERSHH